MSPTASDFVVGRHSGCYVVGYVLGGGERGGE